MKFFKKYWYLILVSFITLGIGVMIFLTSQRLQKTTPVAPTVPQAKPKATAPACTLTFALNISGTPSPTQTPGGPTATPTPTSTPGPTATPTPTITLTPTATPTPMPTATPTPTATPMPNATATPTPGTFSQVSTPTPTPGALAQAPSTPGAEPTPKVPVSGAGPSLLGASAIAGGLLLLLLGLAL